MTTTTINIIITIMINMVLIIPSIFVDFAIIVSIVSTEKLLAHAQSRKPIPGTNSFCRATKMTFLGSFLQGYETCKMEIRKQKPALYTIYSTKMTLYIGIVHIRRHSH